MEKRDSIEKILRKIGLTKNEILLYITLLESGQSSAGNLVKKTKLHRSRVYDSLERLKEKGIIMYVVKDYKRYFEAVNPERILTYLQEKENRLKESEREIRNILPELKRFIKPSSDEPEARVYTGIEGMKAIHNDWIRSKGDMLVWGARGEIFKRMKYYVMQLEKEMRKKGKRFISLMDYDTINDRGPRDSIRKGLTKGRYLPKEFVSPAVIFIYDDRVVNVSWKDVRKPVGFMMISRDLADKYRKYFWVMWETAKPLKITRTRS